MEKKYLITEINPNNGKLETFDYRTGELVGTDLTSKFVYSPGIGQAICNLIREGNTLTKIAARSDMPAISVLYKWKSHHPEFKEGMKQARKDRAEHFHDKAVEALEEADGAAKEDIPALKLRMDGWTKLAEKGNPEEFNPKPNLLQNAKAPTMIVINTGINREPTTIEVNDEKICIGERTESGLRGVQEESGNNGEGSGSVIAGEARVIDPCEPPKRRREPARADQEKES